MEVLGNSEILNTNESQSYNALITSSSKIKITINDEVGKAHGIKFINKQSFEKILSLLNTDINEMSKKKNIVIQEIYHKKKTKKSFRKFKCTKKQLKNSINKFFDKYFYFLGFFVMVHVFHFMFTKYVSNLNNNFMISIRFVYIYFLL